MKKIAVLVISLIGLIVFGDRAVKATTQAFLITREPESLTKELKQTIPNEQIKGEKLLFILDYTHEGCLVHEGIVDIAESTYAITLGHRNITSHYQLEHQHNRIFLRPKSRDKIDLSINNEFTVTITLKEKKLDHQSGFTHTIYSEVKAVKQDNIGRLSPL